MIYSFHHFYYWLKGGVETGQAYRAKVFRNLGLDAKFVFATTFPSNHIWKEMESLGFQNSETIWLYGFFTDCKNSTEVYTLEQFESNFSAESFRVVRKGNILNYFFSGSNIYYVVHLLNEESNAVYRVDIISNACLIRSDYYTYCKIYSEYFTPKDNQAKLCLRRFFNEDGSTAYEEMIEEDTILYKFPDRILYSREELVGYMMSCLKLTKDDVVLIDGEPGMIDRSAFILNAAPARVGFILHSEHYLSSDENHILWYKFYEYALSHPDKIDFFITNTNAQSTLLREQLKKYEKIDAQVSTIPVGALEKIHIPTTARKKHALISAGRLAREKMTEFTIQAVVAAKAQIPDLSLDIYGEGPDRGKLQNLINELDCGDYVRLCGFQNLDEVYQKYDAYISASLGETFGVTLLEAAGSGLPIIGFDARYGAQVFIDEGENGYRVPLWNVDKLTDGIMKLFTEADIEAFREHSYEKAKEYLAGEVEKKWKQLLCPEK